MHIDEPDRAAAQKRGFQTCNVFIRFCLQKLLRISIRETDRPYDTAVFIVDFFICEYIDSRRVKQQTVLADRADNRKQIIAVVAERMLNNILTDHNCLWINLIRVVFQPVEIPDAVFMPDPEIAAVYIDQVVFNYRFGLSIG